MSDPIEITIPLNLDQYLVRFHGYDSEGEERVSPQTLEDIVLGEAARMVVEGIGREQTYQSHRDRVQSIRDEVIRERLVPLIDEAITTALQPTDHYGTPKGEPVTLREVILKEAISYLTKETSDGYNQPRQTVVTKFLRAEVGRVVQTELKKELDAAKAEVSAAVRAEGAALIAKTIERMAER